MVKSATGYEWARKRTTQALKAEVASMRRAEDRLQIAIVELLTATKTPGVVFWHTPNGGKRSKVEAARFKMMGVTAGVPDLVISLPSGAMGFMEIKTPKGTVSQEQTDFLAAMVANGNLTAVVRSLADAASVLSSWGAIRNVKVAA
jgi:hypothetical protein